MAEDFERDCWTLGRKKMPELTDEQFRQAHRLLLDNGYSVSGTLMKTLAPLLQLPWDGPTREEFADIVRSNPNGDYGPGIMWALYEFVRRRNAALLPKPVDPRREAVRKVLESRDKLGLNFDSMIDEILEAVDKTWDFGVTEPDPHTGCVPNFYQDSMLYPNTAKMPQPREPFKPNPVDEVK